MAKRRPPNLEIPYPLAKELWCKVWDKFLRENPKALLLKGRSLSQLLDQITAAGASILPKLKRAMEKPSPPISVDMSRETIGRLCDFITDNELREKLLADPEIRPLFIFFGKYRLFWRDKKNGVVSILHSELKIGAEGVRISDDAGNAIGDRLMLKNTNLFFSAENDSKKSNFIFNVGTAGNHQLSYIPGLCLTLNADATPIGMAVLLTRTGNGNPEPDQALLERYFDKFRGREFVPGVKVSWFSFLPPCRICGLYGHWYIYHAQKDFIRRGKIRIESERRLTYVGTQHEFRQGHIEIFNNTNISITLSNDSKILHLLGRIGDQSDLGQRSRFRCIFSSTGKGGSTLKAGVSLMIRENETPFDEMEPEVIVRENYSKFLNEDDLNLILGSPEDIEI